MPIGSPIAVNLIALHLSNTKPRTVLDLGVGSGFYGAVVRQWCDLGVQPYKTWLAGIEGWEKYRTPCWELYNRVQVGLIQATNLQELLPPGTEARGWQCILMSDVLEHFEQEAGVCQVERAKSALAPGGTLFVSTPGWQSHQGAAHGNELERHRSLFLGKDLEELGFEVLRREGRRADGRNNVIAQFRR